jgi:hypothetical protein
VVQRDLYLRGFLYSFGVIVFIELVRAQVAEVDLLQLIPGFYLIVLFISFLVLLYFSDFLLRIPVEADNDKIFGTKTIERAEKGISLKLSYFLFYFCLGSSLNSVHSKVYLFKIF